MLPPSPPPLLSLSLLLKLAATSITGFATLLACRNMLRNEALQSQLHHIRNSLLHLPRPPTVYVVGFKGRGKSSFVNTACRVLAEEEGPLVFRAETAPIGPTRTTVEVSAVRIAGPEEACLLTLVDTPGLPLRFLTRADVEDALRRVMEIGGPGPDCVVVVLRCLDVLMGPSEMKLAEIVAVLRGKGLHFIVLLTHKKSLKSMRRMGAIRKEVATRARTDCVYFIENYTVGSTMNAGLVVIQNNFETHNTTLAVIRQCMEFAIVHHNNSSLRTGSTARTANRLQATTGDINL